MEYYIVSIIINGEKHFVIWFSNHEDGMITENKKLISFEADSQCRDYALRNGMVLEEEESGFDFDAIKPWLSKPDNKISYNTFLNIWNMMSDLAVSVGIPFLGDGKVYSDIYDKLFFGCNLPAIRGDGELYIPKWNKDEIASIANVLKNGMDIAEMSL